MEKGDKEYLDAKFDGIKEVFAVQHENMKAHISSVALGVKDVREGLQAHLIDKNAHGADVKREIDGKVIGWLTVLGAFSGVIGAAVHKFVSSVGGKP